MNELKNNVVIPELDLETSYNRHYAAVDSSGRITEGWSDGPHPERDPAGAVCINDQDGYQFRLFTGGEENPVLYTEDSIPLYRWDGGAGAAAYGGGNCRGPCAAADPKACEKTRGASGRPGGGH